MTPSGWTTYSLRELLRPVQRLEPVVHSRHYNLLGVRWYAAGCHNHSAAKGSDLKTQTLSRVQAGDVTYNKMWTSKNAFAVVPDNLSGSYATSEYPLFETARPDLLDIQYLIQIFKRGQLAEDASNLRRGTTSRARLNPSDFLGLSLSVPPLLAQKKIAAILGSVDEAIQATQAVIDQTRKVKQGLLQHHICRGKWDSQFGGCDHPPHPLRSLDEAATRGSGHTPNKKVPEYWNGGVKWVSLADSGALDRLYINSTSAEISDLGIANSSAVKHPAGTVVLSRDAGVGKSAITQSEMAVSQHFIAWQCGPELDNHYLYYWLQHMKSVFEHVAIGSTIKTIGLPFFKQLQIPLPPIDDQRRIAGVLRDLDLQILNQGEYLRTLSTIKQGLMADLLTGRKRVEVSA